MESTRLVPALRSWKITSYVCAVVANACYWQQTDHITLLSPHLPYSNQTLPLPLPLLGDKTVTMTTMDQQQLMAVQELLAKSGGRDEALSGELVNYSTINCVIL